MAVNEFSTTYLARFIEELCFSPVAGLQERRERAAATKVETDGRVLGVGAANDVEDDGPVGDGLAEITEGVYHDLQAPSR